MKYIGIDISKASFVAAFPQEKGYRTETFSNDLKGIRKFISKIDPANPHCVMEYSAPAKSEQLSADKKTD